MTDWLIEEPADARAVARSVVFEGARQERGKAAPAPAQTVALRLHDVLIHNNKKWFDIFGGADIRLDAVVVQGNMIEADPAAAYVPTTMRFSGIGDGDRLPTDDYGMLLYYGYPRHFLDISIIVSRDSRDTDDLSTRLAKEMNSGAMKGAMATLLGLAVAAPSAAAVTAAIAAAATMGIWPARSSAACPAARSACTGAADSPTPTSSVRDATPPTDPAIARATSLSGMRSSPTKLRADRATVQIRTQMVRERNAARDPGLSGE